MIIETSDNRFFSVDPAELTDPNLAHVWLGREVKYSKRDKRWNFKPRRPELVRKAATRIVEQ